MNKLEKWIAGGTLVTIVIGLLVQQFWFVPYYIESKVNAQVKTKLDEAGVADLDDTADNNRATITAVQTQLTAMETRMIARDALFMQYLQRQADGNGQ